MKTTGSYLLRVCACLTLFFCFGVSTLMAINAEGLSKKDVKSLLARAKTAEDQHRLAAYYRDKAQELTVKSQEFAKQADFLATQPATIESKQGISCQCTSHYRYFSKRYAQEASEDETLAVQHDRLAQELSQERR